MVASQRPTGLHLEPSLHCGWPVAVQHTFPGVPHGKGFQSQWPSELHGEPSAHGCRGAAPLLVCWRQQACPGAPHPAGGGGLGPVLRQMPLGRHWEPSAQGLPPWAQQVTPGRPQPMGGGPACIVVFSLSGWRPWGT